MSWKIRVKEVVRNLKQISVEPFIFFFMFGYAIRSVSLKSLYFDRACRLRLNYTDDICDNLALHEEAREASQVIGNNVNIGVMMIATVPAIVVATFIGPWSDKYGRKYPLVCCSIGVLIEGILNVIITASPQASPSLFLLCAIPAGISGGFLVGLSSTYSYISDITDERSRPTRYAILEFFFILATPLGTIIGGQVYDSFGYLPVMVISPVSHGCALLWSLIYVKETKARSLDVTKKQMAQDLIRVDNITKSVKSCTMPRPGNLRLQLWLLVFITCEIKFITLGTLAIGYDFTMTMFQWGVAKYSNVSTLFQSLNAIVTVALVPVLNKKLQVHEAAVGLIGILSVMAKQAIFAASTKEWLYYYGWLCGIFMAFSGIGVRSRLSKLVSKGELGRVFSLLAMCESTMPLIGTVTFAHIFLSSMDTFPGLAYVVGCVTLLPSAVMFAWMMRLPTMSFTQYQEAEDAKITQELKDISDYM